MTVSPSADAPERLRAVTTFDRNVVVTAGAGTGKTTLLVDRCVNLLVREPSPVPVNEIVALTFTNKAAHEMKERLRARLEALAETGTGRPRSPGDAGPGETDVLCERYGLTADEVRRRAREALQRMEQSHIGTLHSFAASMLRLYPLEAGLEPNFREGDGRLLERRFDTCWTRWLDGELSGAGPRTGEWKRLLGRFPLARLRELALSLCAENVDLEGLRRGGASDGAGGTLRDWLRRMDETATDLLTRHPEQRKIEQAVAVARRVVRSASFDFASLRSGRTEGAPRSGGTGGVSRSGETRGVLRSGRAEAMPRSGGTGATVQAFPKEPVDDEDLSLLSGVPSPPKGWSREDFERARNLWTAARPLARTDDAEVDGLCALLAPFARECRDEFSRSGLVTFDGLLVRARDLLRDHPRIREDLKERFRAILVDEFQDTDPLQYEILLWLCEEPSGRAEKWRDVRLAPGKLFVVGDPKQSIYGFRGADIEAYLHVVREMIEAQQGVECRLTANFRSDARILDAVNGVFERLLEERPGLQPEHIPLRPGRGGADEEAAAPVRVRTLRGRGRQRSGDAEAAVRVRRVTTPGRTLGAAEARRVEARSLARWVDEEVVGGRTFCRDGEGNRVQAQPGHVAYLMRSLTHVQTYLEPLRRRGIGYVVEGERDFYAAQEVVDAVNLLRTLDDPYDRVALVGVLRSPLGGHDDVEILALSRQSLLDYRLAEGPRRGELPPGARDLYRRLLRLHREVRFLEAGSAVDRVFEELPLSVLAASGGSGPQAAANLEKVRLMAREAGADGNGTLKEVAAEFERRVREAEDEAESALEEETPDAVRVMSIHKAKGLEFPVVVLVDALGGVDARRGPQVEVWQDWSTDLTGLRMDDLWSLPGVFLHAKQREREEYERRRLLYVAMTRPRQRLVVSFADRDRRGGDSLLSMLEQAAEAELTAGTSRTVACGAGGIEVEVVEEDPEFDEPGVPPAEATRGDADGASCDWSSYESLWRGRRERYEARRQAPTFLSPSRLKEAGEAAQARRPRGLQRDTALVLGEAAHRMLEHWDFQTRRPAEDLEGAIARHASGLPPEQQTAVVDELKAMWAALIGSPLYEELRTARILGREIPFVLPWEGETIMEGVIDVVYERGDRLYVADYKTDRVDDGDTARVMEEYGQQARVYTEAVRRSLDREVAAFRLLLLRLGRGVTVPVGANGGDLLGEARSEKIGRGMPSRGET